LTARGRATSTTAWMSRAPARSRALQAGSSRPCRALRRRRRSPCAPSSTFARVSAVPRGKSTTVMGPCGSRPGGARRARRSRLTADGRVNRGCALPHTLSAPRRLSRVGRAPWIDQRRGSIGSVIARASLYSAFQPEANRAPRALRACCAARDRNTWKRFLSSPSGAAGDREELMAALAERSRSRGEDPVARWTIPRAPWSPAIAEARGRALRFVVGAGLPAAMAADWLPRRGPERLGSTRSSPAGAAAEKVTFGWLLELLGLTRESSMGLVTGGQTPFHPCLLRAERGYRRADGTWSAIGLIEAPPLPGHRGAEAPSGSPSLRSGMRRAASSWSRRTRKAGCRRPRSGECSRRERRTPPSLRAEKREQRRVHPLPRSGAAHGAVRGCTWSAFGLWGGEPAPAGAAAGRTGDPGRPTGTSGSTSRTTAGIGITRTAGRIGRDRRPARRTYHGPAERNGIRSVVPEA